MDGYSKWQARQGQTAGPTVDNPRVKRTAKRGRKGNLVEDPSEGEDANAEVVAVKAETQTEKSYVDDDIIRYRHGGTRSRPQKPRKRSLGL